MSHTSKFPTRVQAIESPARRTLIAVASDALDRRIGDRLPTGTDYQSTLGVGAGTVRKAIEELHSLGALETSSHGQLGTQVIAKNSGLLWDLTGRRPCRLMSTPPGALDQMGAASALHDEIERAGVFVTTSYRRAARRRVDHVVAGDADVAILSKRAARSLAAGSDRIVAHDLTGVHYYDTALFVTVSLHPDSRQRRRTPGRRQRVAIDRDSEDHITLTHLIYAEHDCEFVNLPFPLIPREVLRGNVDAGVWHRVSTLITPEDAGLVTEPLPRDKLDVLARDLLDASIVWRAEDLALTRLVEGLDLDRMRDTQLAHMRKTYDDDEVFAASFMA